MTLRNISNHFDGPDQGRSNTSRPATAGREFDPARAKRVAKILVGFAKQRRVALAGAGSRALYAADAILRELDGAWACTPYAIARRVARASKHISILAPSSRSRYYNHYTTVIAPLVSWCMAYVDRHSQPC